MTSYLSLYSLVALLIPFFFQGGTLRIYADSLKPNIPYKTILLSTTDTADFAVIEALEKYGLEKENPKDYCIARVSSWNTISSFHIWLVSFSWSSFQALSNIFSLTHKSKSLRNCEVTCQVICFLKLQSSSCTKLLLVI